MPDPGWPRHNLQRDRNGALTRIGLLTPYDGSNLGDGTIQTAVIHHLRRRDPRIELLGLTLDPEDTQQRHEIPAFGITGLSVPSYSEGLLLGAGPVARTPAATTPPAADTGEPESREGGLRQALKSIPLLGPMLRALLRTVRSARRWVPELRHLRASLRTVRDLDLLLISGGGQLDEEFGGPWGHPYVLFRWTTLARLTGTPVAFASVGVGYMNRRLSRFFIRAALKGAKYRSFRDPGSLERVAAWGFTRHDPCAPDLAFGAPVPVPAPGREPKDGMVVGVSPMIYGHAKHWPTARQQVYEGYARRLAEFAAGLLEDGHTLLLFQSSGADRVALGDLRASLIARFGPSITSRLREPEVRSVEQFFREVAAADLVIASRLHGVLMSHLLGKPVVAISFDRKVDAHMETMGLSDYRLDIARFESAELRERFASLVAHRREISAQVVERVARFRAELDRQFDTLLGLAGAAPAPEPPSPVLQDASHG
jgi:polysaccharide pyruvyl transferase WcaK-like protein